LGREQPGEAGRLLGGKMSEETKKPEQKTGAETELSEADLKQVTGGAPSSSAIPVQKAKTTAKTYDEFLE